MLQCCITRYLFANLPVCLLNAHYFYVFMQIKLVIASLCAQLSLRKIVEIIGKIVLVSFVYSNRIKVQQFIKRFLVRRWNWRTCVKCYLSGFAMLWSALKWIPRTWDSCLSCWEKHWFFNGVLHWIELKEIESLKERFAIRCVLFSCHKPHSLLKTKSILKL